jgi:endonuclease/exonuclease/phosphatase (EEP) superfamily protein YafD
LNSSDLSKERLWRSIVVACALPVAMLTWILWFALGIGYLGAQVWFLDLFANFRVQYVVLFALCVVALTIVRWRKTALVALVGVASTTATMAPFFQERAAVAASGPTFRLVTFNTWFRNDDFAVVANFLRASNADVLVLQEITAASLAKLDELLPGYPHRSLTRGGRHALVILSRWPLDSEHLQLANRLTRIIRTRVRWNQQEVTLIAAHLNWPLGRENTAMRSDQLRAIAERAQDEVNPLVVAGDFNLTPWSDFYRRFVADSGLIDCAIGQGLRPTWPAQASAVRIRIDLCFTSEHWRVHRLDVGPRLGSDHLPVVVDLELVRSQ